MKPLLIVPAGAAAPVSGRGLRSCRFDDETLVWGTSERARLPDRLRQAAGRSGAAQGDLYLVVQVGNAFVMEFP